MRLDAILKRALAGGPRHAFERQAVDNPEAAAAWMTAWIAQRLRVPESEIQLDTPFTELGLDSLVAVELSGRLEELLGNAVDPAAAWDFPTVRELAAALFTPISDQRSVHVGDDLARP